MNWCFAKVNNKLAEIYFEKNQKMDNKILAHCYIKIEDYKTKIEKLWIGKESKKLIFTYKDKKYIKII